MDGKVSVESLNNADRDLGLRYRPLEELRIATFDCGNGALNRFLLRFAFQNQQANASQTYAGLAEDKLAGFYTLVVGEVTTEDAPERAKKGLARHPVPLMLLARMGVSIDWDSLSFVDTGYAACAAS